MKKMHKNIVIALISIAAMVSCSTPANKKILIMGRGDITSDGNDITMKDGSGYAEKTVEVNEDKPVNWNVTTPTGKTTVNIPEEKGFYILNLKTDTIVGSQQIMGTDISSNRVISQEELKTKIDSLIGLTTGANITAGGHSYIILPGQIKKVADEMDVNVYGPFTKIPGTLEADKNGKVPPIYKFYTNGEMRQLIANLKKMSY